MVPDDLQHELNRDSAAAADLDARNRYTNIWRINEATRPETRQRRITTYAGPGGRGRDLHRRPAQHSKTVRAWAARACREPRGGAVECRPGTCFGYELGPGDW
ncbi:YdeI/OmpD-associated family protein [Nocardia sp. NPDC056100]|uniref:YdeI/OmpD-associated family protein n=1 Tax=Nocardia sp. NPDC056100 TaxID=3345712 RepID=UPI0035DE6C4A